MDQPRSVIEPEEAESMAQKSGLTILQLLPSLLKSAKTLARPLISNYHVGAVGLGSSGRIFLGSNIEIPGLPLHHVVHAEQFLVTNLILNAERHLQYIALSTAPCGHCRQFLQDIRDASDIKILVTSPPESTNLNKDGFECDCNYNYQPLPDIFPGRFGPDDLISKEVPLLLESRNNALVFVDNNDVIGATSGDLKSAALEAANKSHTPYSKCPSGVALMDCEGRVYKGFYMESAAYNPSFGPVQAALVALVAYVAENGSCGYERIVAAALVEKTGGVVQQEKTTRLILEVVSPKCQLQVFYCKEAI